MQIVTDGTAPLTHRASPADGAPFDGVKGGADSLARGMADAWPRNAGIVEQIGRSEKRFFLQVVFFCLFFHNMLRKFSERRFL